MRSGLVRAVVCITGIILGVSAVATVTYETDRASATDSAALPFKLFIGNVARDDPRPQELPSATASATPTSPKTPAPTRTPSATLTATATSTPQGSSAYALVTSWYAHINDTLFGRYTAILDKQISGQLTLSQAGAALLAEKPVPDAYKAFLDGQAATLNGASPECNYARQYLSLSASYLGLMEGWGGLILDYGSTPEYLNSRQEASNKYFEFMSQSLGFIAGCTGSAAGAGATPPPASPSTTPIPSTPTPTATPAPAASGAIDSCIEGEFVGWDGDTVFELCNGQVWVQASYAYVYHYAYRPHIRIVATGGGGYQMTIDGVPTSVGVRQVSVVAKTCISGSFQGFKGSGTLFTLCNGQVWKQTSYTYEYHYAYGPTVLIFSDGGLKMQVEGMSATVNVTRIN